MADNEALQDSEQDGATAVLSGDDGESQPGPSSAPAQALAPSNATPSASAGPSGVQVDTSEKVHPHVAILAGLVTKLLSGIQNASGNPNNAFDRGFMNASPQNQKLQQAQVSKAMSDADSARALASINGLKAIQYEFAVKNLPQERQQQHLDAVSKFKEYLIKEGANVESEDSDEQGADAHTKQLNETDPRATGHLGNFMSFPSPQSDGSSKWASVYIPNAGILQHDWTSPDGKTTIKAGTPMQGGVGQFIKGSNEDIKDYLKDMHGTLANAKPPETQDAADLRKAQLNSFLNIAGKTDPVWTKLAQDEIANIDKGYASLPKTAAAQKEQIAHIESADKSAEADARKDRNTFGYALDKNGETAYMSRADAQKMGSTFEQMSPADVNKDRATLRQLNDVQMNVSKYEAATRAMTENVEHTDAIHRIIAGVKDEDVSKAAFVTLGAAMSMMEQSEVKDSWNKLNDKERRLMIGYLRAKGGIVAYNRALTGSGRANEKALMIEMANLPTPDVGAKVAIPQLRSFQENIDQAASGLPTNLPGMKNPKQVRTEVWRDDE